MPIKQLTKLDVKFSGWDVAWFTYFKVLHALANLLDVTCALGSHNERSFWWGIDSALSGHQILEIQSAEKT